MPAEIRVGAKAATLEQAHRRRGLAAGRRGRGRWSCSRPDLTTRAQRTAIALADALRADSGRNDLRPAAAGILAAQRRGRAGATLGEIKNRADVILFWAVDPRERYPRFLERYAARPARIARTVSVSVGRRPAGPRRRSSRWSLPRNGAGGAGGHSGGRRGASDSTGLSDALRPAVAIGERLLKGRYVAIVYDAEPGQNPRDDQRAESLIALAQALNGPTRATLCGLRAGGNRSGAEAVLTWQTGYPLRWSSARVIRAYRADRAAAGAASAPVGLDAVLVAGARGIAGRRSRSSRCPAS